MRRIREKAARLRRYPRGRGFGVQSPNDYNFITKVVKRHADDDCCAAADRINTDTRSDNYKFVHLCYRVARYLKPSKCICLTTTDDNVENYIRAAVPECSISHTCDEAGCNDRTLVILSPMEKDAAMMDKILSVADDMTWMITEGIRISDDAYTSWKTLTEDVRTRITFDLYHYGIISFDKKRYKQDYKIYL